MHRRLPHQESQTANRSRPRQQSKQSSVLTKSGSTRQHPSPTSMGCRLSQKRSVVASESSEQADLEWCERRRGNEVLRSSVDLVAIQHVVLASAGISRWALAHGQEPDASAFLLIKRTQLFSPDKSLVTSLIITPHQFDIHKASRPRKQAGQ